MEAVWTAIWGSHVALGFVALVSFWVPVLSRKGSGVHRRAGRVFLGAMVGVSLTALAMSGLAMAWPEVVHPDRTPHHSRVVAGFLGYLGVASLVAVHNAAAAVWWRDDKLAPWRLWLNQALVGLSVGMLALAFVVGSPLLGAMSPVGIGVWTGWRAFVREHDSRAWLRAHIGATLVGGIAAHTAFIAGGGARFVPWLVDTLGWVAWLVPTLVGVPVLVAWQRRYPASPPG